MQIQTNFLENLFYHVIVRVDSVDPANVYNPEYSEPIPVGIDFSAGLSKFLSENIGLISHFPFYYTQSSNQSLWEALTGFLHSNTNITGFELTKNITELKVKLEIIGVSFKELWVRLSKQNYLDRFNALYLPYIQEAQSFFAGLHNVCFVSEFSIHLLYAIPRHRGKNINYANKRGIAIAFPALTGGLDYSYLQVIIHEVAHHYSDPFLEEMGYSLPSENSGESYLLREAVANFFTDLFFNSLLLNLPPLANPTQIPNNLLEKITTKYSQSVPHIKFVHLGQYSKGYQPRKAKNLSLISDFFLIKEQESILVFFVASLGKIVSVPKKFFKNNQQIKPVYLAHFQKAGLLVPKGDSPKVVDFELVHGEQYQTTKIRFHITSACNLKCTYCYLDGGTKKEKIKIDIVEKALGLLARGSGPGARGIEDQIPIQIEFHGGGEPTLEFELIKKIYEEARGSSPEPQFLIQSNGLFPKKIADWLMEKDFSISISIDGPKHIQEKQRPGNKNSFNKIVENIKYLVQNNAQVFTISVITKDSLPELLEIYEFIKALGIKRMMFNPISPLGRAEGTQTIDPGPRAPGPEPPLNYMDFARRFFEVLKKSMEDNITVLSDFLPTFHDYYPRNYVCDACSPGCNVHYNGDIVACTRTYDIAPVEDNPFVWGKIKGVGLRGEGLGVAGVNGLTVEGFNGGAGAGDSSGFCFDIDKKQELENRVVQNISQCENCFLKYICCGDCLNELYLASGDFNKIIPERCEAKRWFGKEWLVACGVGYVFDGLRPKA